MELNRGRWTAQLDGDFVVFLIGAAAHDPDGAEEAGALLMAMVDHVPVWQAWNLLSEDDRAGAGIWHETFQVVAGSYEAVYQNMPVIGLAKAGTSLTVAEAKDTARARLTQ